MSKEITCLECEAEFQVVHDEVGEPEFCPFCGEKMRYEDSNLDEDDWLDDDT